MEIEIVKYHICYKSPESDILWVHTEIDDEMNKKVVNLFLKYMKKNEEFSGLTDQEILKDMLIIKQSPPTSFPKFNNETPFKLKWDKGFVINPKIVKSQWTGWEWRYQVENYGHKYPEIKESKLYPIEK